MDLSFENQYFEYKTAGNDVKTFAKYVFFGGVVS
jgi:hypothetical protein